jgi:DDE_Tnp_1-associated
MPPAVTLKSDKSRLAVLLDHFARIEDPRILHPLCEVLLLVVCGTIADCDDYDHIAAWGEAHLDFLRRYAPFAHGVPGGRWLTNPHEPDQPGALSGSLYGLGARDLAGPS